MNRVQSLLLIASVPLFVVIMINVHEVGHTFFARLFGDSGATYHFYRRFPEGGYCIGCNIYDERRLSYVGNIMVTIGGVIFTQVTAVVTLLLRNTRIRRGFAQRLATTFAAVFVFDAPFQVLQGMMADVESQTSLIRVDMADFIYLLTSETGLRVDAAKLALFAALVLYLMWVIRLYRFEANRHDA